MRPRIDVHAHFVPEVYREALINAGQSEPDGIKGLPEWTEQSQLAAMERLGVTTSYLSISSPGVYFGDVRESASLSRAVNEEALHLIEGHPGRFGYFASVPVPGFDEAEAELRYALDHLGAVGAVLETNTAGVYLGDARLDGLYAILNERKAVLFIHPTTPFEGEHLALGYPRPMLEFIFETTRSVTNLLISGVAARFPDMRIIVPHAGAALPILANRIEFLLPILAKGGVTPPSIKEALRTVHFDLAGAPVPELLTALLAVADPSHVHYGSDYPFTPLDGAARLAGILDETNVLSEELREMIYTTNSVSLFS